MTWNNKFDTDIWTTRIINPTWADALAGVNFISLQEILNLYNNAAELVAMETLNLSL